MKTEDYKEYIFSGSEKVMYLLLYSFMAFSGGMLFFKNIIISLCCTVVVPLFMKNIRKKKTAKRNIVIRNEFCDSLQLISISLSSGKSVNRAFAEVWEEMKILYGNRNSIMIKEYMIISRNLSMNYILSDCLKDLADRTGSKDISGFQEAEELCSITGGNIIEIVKNTYQVILQKNETEDDIDIICAQQKLSFNILMIIPFAIVLLMNMLSGEYMKVMFTMQGRIITAICLMVMVCAYIIGNKIVSDDDMNMKEVKNGQRAVIRKENKIIGFLRKYSYERKFVQYFSEIFDKDYEIYYRNHRYRQIKMLIFILLTGTAAVLITQKYLEIGFLVISSIAGAVFINDRNIKDRVKRRRKIIEYEFPDFLNRLAILTDAGITIKSAIKRIANSMEDGELKKQLLYLINDYSYGVKDEICFENFAKRCRTKEAAAFSTLVLQSLRKGGREFSAILRIHGKSSWEKKKAEAKIRGEEKSMKLMIPTMLVFIALMVIMAAPAVINMNIL